MQNDTPIVQDQAQEAPPTQELPTEQPAEQPEGEQKADGEGEGEEKPAKPEKTPEQRELERLRKAIDRKTKRAAEAEYRAQQFERELQQYRVQQRPIDDINWPSASDSDTAKPTPAQIEALVEAEIRRRSEVGQRQKVIDSLAKDWGQEKFDSVAEDLRDALGGLMVNGKPKPAADAIFASETPKEVIEYLRDPDNADEAEAFGSMDAVKAGRFIAKLETKLQAEKARAKPQRSNAPAPIEPVRAQGTVNSMPDPKNLKAWILEMNRREAAGKL